MLQNHYHGSVLERANHRSFKLMEFNCKIVWMCYSKVNTVLLGWIRFNLGLEQE